MSDKSDVVTTSVVAARNAAEPATHDSKPRVLIQTVRLDPRDLKPSWPIVIASLEQLAGWAVAALRLGTLAIIQERAKELSKSDAKPELVADLLTLVDALAHMPVAP